MAIASDAMKGLLKSHERHGFIIHVHHRQKPSCSNVAILVPLTRTDGSVSAQAKHFSCIKNGRITRMSLVHPFTVYVSNSMISDLQKDMNEAHFRSKMEKLNFIDAV